MFKASKGIIIFILFLAVLAGTGMVLAQGLFNREEAASFLEKHTPLVDEALKAYNDEDFARFFGTFSSGRISKTERAFKVIWMEGYKAKYGNFVSKSLDRDMCSFNDLYPLLVYKAKFEKNDGVTIKISFSREGRSYRIFYMRFDAD